MELTPQVATWLAEHHGVITTAALSRLGVGRTARDRLAGSGVLIHRHKSVYVLAGTPVTLEQRLAALCAAHPKGFVTGPTAAKLLGLRRLPKESPLHFAVAHGARLDQVPGVRLRQTTALFPWHSELRPDGVRIAAPARLAFDLAADLRPLDHLSVLHQLVDSGLVSGEELVDVARRLCHPARPGSRRFAVALERLGNHAAGQSDPEVTVGEALRLRGVPVERQVAVECGDLTVHLDLAVPAVKWGIELDIHPEHRSIEGHGRDTKRYRLLHEQGWRIEPVSEADLADLDRLVADLARLYAQHCR